MSRLPEDLSQAAALVVDQNPTSRSILVGQLREFGFGQVVQCGRTRDARKMLEFRRFDLVLCEMDFQGEPRGGQQLLDELRREQLLPLSTVFIMVTGERSYDKVAEAAEAALDSYLIKPFTAQSLWDRVRQSRRRKDDLKEIFVAIEGGDFDTAAALCSQRFEARGRYWLYAARLGAELYLRLGKLEQSRQLFDAVVAAQAVPWARLGIARVQLEQQQTGAALTTLEALVGDDPGYTDAYDVMGRAQMALGQLPEALETWRRAAELTPGAIRRQQSLGMLALCLGDHDTAVKALERAAILGQGSKLFDPQTLVALGLLRLRERDGKGLARCSTDLHRLLERQPESPRLRRFELQLQTFELLLQHQTAKVLDRLARLAEQIMAPDFDVEAACNLAGTLAEVVKDEVQVPNADDWVIRLGRRFCGSRAVSELLSNAAGALPRHAELLRRCHAQVAAAAEKAMMLSVSGKRSEAVQTLLRHGASTLNQKFTDAAQGILTRYGSTMTDAQPLGTELEGLRNRMGRGSAALPQFALQGGQSGGLRLRLASGEVKAD